MNAFPLTDLPHPLRTLWPTGDRAITVLDQRRLPHELLGVRLNSAAEATEAIRTMVVRGAPLIGATAAYGVWLAAQEAAQANDPEATYAHLVGELRQARPTAVNLAWAINQVEGVMQHLNSWPEKVWCARLKADEIVENDVATCRSIGEHGLPVLEALAAQKNGAPLNILTHCNAGMLGCIEWGTATSPIYQAHQKGLPVHVWVDETRPRNQGASLTAWELNRHGVPHTVIVDNAGGHLMQHGQVDLAIVGTDRVSRQGDVANKIGTYLKALAAKDNNLPFYVAAPSSSVDWEVLDGVRDIPIEERDPQEVTHLSGQLADGSVATVRLTPAESAAANYGFDVTPARLITGLITERGVCAATEAGLRSLFPEHVVA